MRRVRVEDDSARTRRKILIFTQVTLAVGNTVKRVVIIAAAMVVLGEAMEPVAMVGTTVAIAGVLLYSILKQRLA